MCKERFRKDFWGDRANVRSSSVFNGFASVAGIAARDNQKDLLRRDPSKELDLAHLTPATKTPLSEQSSSPSTAQVLA